MNESIVTSRLILQCVIAGAIIAGIVTLCVPAKMALDQESAPSLWECEDAVANTRVCRRAIQVRDPRDQHLELQVQTIQLIDEKVAVLMQPLPLKKLENMYFSGGIQVNTQDK